MGVDIIFNWDHFFPLTGDRDGLHFEAWTMLGAIAEQTSRVEFGPLVNCNGYRNPDLQADMARTLDHISGGPVHLRHGFGLVPARLRRVRLPFGTAGSRLDQLAVDLPRIRSRWEKLNPAPTRPIPILIGGGGEQKTLRIVAEHADIWHSFADPDTLVRKIDVLRHWCDEVGRDVSEIELSTGTSIRGHGLDRACGARRLPGPRRDAVRGRDRRRATTCRGSSGCWSGAIRSRLTRRLRRHRVVRCPFLAVPVSPVGPSVSR